MNKKSFQGFIPILEKVSFKLCLRLYSLSPLISIKLKYFLIFYLFSNLDPKRYSFLYIVTYFKDIRNFLNLRSNNSFKYYNFYRNQKKFYGKYEKLLAIGPNIDYEKIIEKDFYKNSDAIVINKITQSSYNSSKPHIYILNNYWTSRNLNLISKVRNDKKNSIILTPQKSEFSHGDYDYLIKEYLNLPFKISAMGLQRTLLILPLLFDHNELNIVGYNLGISKKPYSYSYPSLFPKDPEERKNEMAFSIFTHSFVYNYSLTRLLINNYPKKIQTNSTKDLLTMNFKDIFNLYINYYKI